MSQKSNIHDFELLHTLGTGEFTIRIIWARKVSTKQKHWRLNSNKDAKEVFDSQNETSG